MLYFLNKSKYILLLLLCMAHVLLADRSKQALRAIEKEDYEKAKEYLIRSYDVDSLNPLVSYAYAKFYVAPSNEQGDLDTAHDYILAGMNMLPDRTEDHSDEMDKSDVTEESFSVLKMYIDSLAYQRAVAVDEIEAYAFFINYYPNAEELGLAKSRRNELQFRVIVKEGTWEAYQDFVLRYPEAAQYAEAKERFDRLAFEEKTRSNQLADLEQFLVDFPDTPYRDEVETMIYQKKVAGLLAEDIMDFVNHYQNPRLTQKALGLLYHSGGIDADQLASFNRSVYHHFMDSVAALEALNAVVLYPFYKEGKYAFFDLEGSAFLGGPYEDISFSYLCGGVEEEVLEVKQNGLYQLINRAGTVIYEGALDSYRDLGNGILAVIKEGKEGAITLTGDLILPNVYEKIDVLDDRLIVFQQNGKKGLAGITGQVFLEPAYDDIYLEGSFWVVEVDGVFGVTSLDEILHDQREIELAYEEVELINEDYIVGYTADHEFLINGGLQVVSPEATISINTLYETWVFRVEAGYYVYDKKFGHYSELIYDDILQNYEWIGLNAKGAWSVHNKSMDDEPILNIDSLKLIGDDIAIVFSGERGTAIFPNKKVVEVEEGEYLQTVSSSRRTEVHYLVIRRDGILYLYKDGVLQFRCDYDEIGFVADDVFSVKEGNKYGAVDAKGKLIMKVNYDAISEAKDGVSHVLLDGEFGAFDFNKRQLLTIGFQEKFRRYNEALFVVKEEDGYGLLGIDNQQRIDGVYDQIEYWTDSAVLAHRNGQWEVRAIYSDEVYVSGIDGYQYFSDSSSVKTIEVRIDNKYGVYHAERGLIIPAVFNDIYNVGSLQQNVYFAERVFPEGDFYVVVYYDAMGNKIRSEAYRGNEYELIVCDD
ncbi:hypothetical protein BGP76_03150 [Reichenbachiella sp. MSK19-1]|nr:hypothetical protein BGP76_03150 [Reichenbachiella sp. MSK19-1]